MQTLLKALSESFQDVAGKLSQDSQSTLAKILDVYFIEDQELEKLKAELKNFAEEDENTLQSRELCRILLNGLRTQYKTEDNGQFVREKSRN